jgi:hypothetical protein
VYLGNIGSDTFAVIISMDNKTGMFITRLAATGEAIIAKFEVGPLGTFSTMGTSSVTVSADPTTTPATSALTAPRTITGTVMN